LRSFLDSISFLPDYVVEPIPYARDFHTVSSLRSGNVHFETCVEVGLKEMYVLGKKIWDKPLNQDSVGDFPIPLMHYFQICWLEKTFRDEINPNIGFTVISIREFYLHFFPVRHV